MIIKNVHQIWITDNDVEPSDYIQYQMNQVKTIYNDYEYKLWRNSDIIELLSEYFDEKTLNAYKKINAYAFKADLARYCILYIHGGIYIDSALKPLHKIDFTDPLIIAQGISSPEVTKNKPILENNLIICNQLNHQFLKSAIDRCIENITNEYYHQHPLEITGPIMLGAIKDVTDVIKVSVNYYRGSKCTFVNDQPFMKHKHHRTQSNLLKLNCKGTNNYEKMWFDRKIY